MPRSVVLKRTPRCVECQLPPRWCICGGFRPVDCALKVDVLIHYMESLRPSSTGTLINRVMPSSGRHVFRRERPLERAAMVQPGKSLWILHPAGEPLPLDEPVAGVQVLLLDGTWVQANGMMRAVEGWGRRVSLPMVGASRYWLRTQADEGRFSTAEALLFLLAALGLRREHDELRRQFELHVYASLCARGKKRDAADYLVDSPLRDAFPDLLAELARRRPR